MQWVLGHYLCSSSIAKMRPSCTGSYKGLGKSGVLSDSAGMMDPRTLSRNVGRGIFKVAPCSPASPVPGQQPHPAPGPVPWPLSLCLLLLARVCHAPDQSFQFTGPWETQMTWEDVMSEWVGWRTTPHILKVAPIWSRWKKRVSLGFLTLAQLST